MFLSAFLCVCVHGRVCVWLCVRVKSTMIETHNLMCDRGRSGEESAAEREKDENEMEHGRKSCQGQSG